MVKKKKAERREIKAKNDSVAIESWCGSETWRNLVRKAMQGLVYIWEHKDLDDFFTKDVHQLSNQLICIIIFLNCFPGRCGGWESITREDMVSQLLTEDHQNILTFTRHKTVKVYGPLKKWVPNSVWKALVMYSELPIRRCEYFFTPHTASEKIIASHVLQCACVTLGYPGAVPNTNYVRKLYATLISAGETIEAESWDRAIQDLATIDAHSATMARSIHYDVSDRIVGGVIKKSVRSFYTVMKAMPVNVPEEPMGDEEFELLVKNMGKRGVKRPAPDDDSEVDDAVTKAQKQALTAQIKEIGASMLAERGKTKYEKKMFREIVDLLRAQGEHVTFFAVRYALTRR